MAAQFPDVRTFSQSGSMQDAILNQGSPLLSTFRSIRAIWD